MHHVSPIRGVAVLVALEDSQRRTGAVESLDAGHDVDHRFSIETRYGRAPDVLNRASHQPWADRLDKKRAFSLTALDSNS